ncbi:hypothetical protein [Methylomicrobium lacus]|uniref:hypothetical protein n=1 Tax=Methylomicrobium lacus TaxID=136992 RepID=UPI0035A9012D
MKTTDEYSHLVDEYVERSARIDKLVEKSRQGEDVAQELEALRAKQREANQILQKLEVSSSSIWENIGNGG